MQKTLNLPTKVKIAGLDFTVKYSYNLENDTESLAGQLTPNTKIIDICLTSNESIDEIMSTLFHEAIHAALYQSGISAVIGDEKVEEGIVVIMEHTFANHLRRKSGLFTDWRDIPLKGAK